MKEFKQEIEDMKAWMSSSRFKETTRIYSARQVVEQRGTIRQDYTVAREAAEGFYELLVQLRKQGKSITTFGPYSPGHVVMMKRLGIQGIYLGGWATSAKGSVTEDPGADLASYPLSAVPDEAAVLVRALLAADKNQQFARSRMSEKDRKSAPVYDFRPFIIADADTGHGGDAHVRNLVRRFVEAGVCGYHIEDQKPGAKKCGHQGGKVLVSVNEQIKRLSAARLQLDIMGVPGLIVARTDAEAATLLESDDDGRDGPFILGATNTQVPPYKNCYLALLKRCYDQGVEEINGHLLFELKDPQYRAAYAWMEEVGVLAEVDKVIKKYKGGVSELEKLVDSISSQLVKVWEQEAGLKTFAEAVADAMRFHGEEGVEHDMTVEQWLEFAGSATFYEIQEKAEEMGLDPTWDCERVRTPEGYYQVRGGLEYAIAKSLAVAPFADIIWMETKTADLAYAQKFATAMHAVYPGKMLAYNLSPSFNWDTTGMNDDEMRAFPQELGKAGYVFNFITYGGHQIDGLAAEEFTTALKENGMLALAQLQRKFRLLESPYKTPQSHVGGPRLDGALMAASGRTATTKAMGKGSTQVQHLVQTEVPPKLLEEWLGFWAEHHNMAESISVKLRPHLKNTELLQLTVSNDKEEMANIVFSNIQDRRDRHILSVRDQTTAVPYRQKRLMTLMKLFLIHRYRADSIHYVSPTEDNHRQCKGMRRLGIFEDVSTDIGDIIVASINRPVVRQLLESDREELNKLISKVPRLIPVT